MSYEGSVEFLCVRGHHSGCNCWDDEPTHCRCGEPIVFRHSIDDTNGPVDNEPGTKPATLEEIGFDDYWRVDHHGNRYATKMLRYRPLEHWQPIGSPSPTSAGLNRV